MLKSYSYKNITWIDVQSPDRDEIKQLSEVHNLDPRISHETFTPSPIAEAKRFDDVFFAVLHFPVYKQTHTDKTEHTQEIDFIVGKDFIISIRYDTIDTLHRFTRKLEVDAITRASAQDKITGMNMFYSIVREFQQSTIEELRHINDQIIILQKNLTHKNEQKLITDISDLGITLLEFQNSLMMHKEAYEVLSGIIDTTFGEKENLLIMDIRKHHYKISSEVSHYRLVSTELRETHLSLLNARQNEIVKKLTILAFLTFPITIVSALFSMTTKSTPLVGLENDFWIILGLMCILTIVAYVFFFYKRWL